MNKNDYRTRVPVPADIHNMIVNTCDNLPSREIKKIIFPKKLAISSISIAAAFILMFGLNMANPVFAESIPLIGNIFKIINADTGAPVGSNIDSYEKIQELNNIAASFNGCEISANEIYSDGKYVHVSFTLEVPQEILAYEHISMEATASINNVQLTCWDGITFYKDGDVFKGKASWELKDSVLDGEDSVLSVNCLMFKVFSENYSVSSAVENLNLSLELPFAVDTANNTAIQNLSGSGEINIESLEINPSYTRIQINTPFLGFNRPLVFGSHLYLEDGTELRENVIDQAFDETDMFAQRENITLQFDGVPKGTEKVILRSYDRDSSDPDSKVIFETVINIDAKSYEQTENNCDDYLGSLSQVEYAVGFEYQDFDYHSDKGFFASEDMFQNDFAIFNITAPNDGTLKYVLLKQGDFRPIDIVMEKNGEEISRVSATEDNFWNSLTKADIGGDTEEAARASLSEEKMNEKMGIVSEDKIDDEVNRIMDSINSGEFTVDGQNYYGVNADYSGALKLMDNVDVKIIDTKTGEVLFAKNIRFIL